MQPAPKSRLDANRRWCEKHPEYKEHKKQYYRDHREELIERMSERERMKIAQIKRWVGG